MNTYLKTAYPRLRLVMMLFMLLSMSSSLGLTASAGPADSDATGLDAFQANPTAELCYALDTNGNLTLSQEELSVLAGAPYNYTNPQITEVATFCANLPSQVLIVDNGSQQPQDDASITVEKRFCATDESGNQNSNCTGRLPAEGPVTFNVYAGSGTGGAQLPDIVISNFPQGNGSQGQVTVGDFSAGATYTVCEVPPAGWDAIPRPGTQGGSNQSGSGDCIIVTLDSGNNVLQFNNFPIPPSTSELQILKWFCPEAEGVLFDAAPPDDGSGCRLATAADDVDITLVGGVPETTYTLDELSEGVELAIGGIYQVYEDGAPLGEPLTIGQNDRTIHIINPEVVQTYGVLVQKWFCMDEGLAETAPILSINGLGEYTDCRMAGAGDIFTLSLVGEGVDLTSDEFLNIQIELLPGTYEIYEGDTLVGEFYVVEADLTVNVLNYEEEPVAVGMVIVEKYYCDDPDIEAPVVSDPEAFDNCEAGEGIFDLLDDTLASGGTSVLDDGDDLFAGLEVPFGTYYLVEWFDGGWIEMATVVVGPNATELTYTIINPGEEETVNLDIYKAVCKDVDETDEMNPCIPSNALDGDTIDYVALALDSEGEIIDEVETSLVVEDFLGSAVVEGLPEADFYAVCEVVPDGIETVYIYSLPTGELFEVEDLAACILITGEDIDEDNLIEVLFLNDVEDEKPEEPQKPEKPHKPDVVVPQKPAPPVTKLPDTGSGPVEQNLVAPWMLITGAAALAGTGAFLRKERPAA